MPRKKIMFREKRVESLQHKMELNFFLFFIFLQDQ